MDTNNYAKLPPNIMKSPEEPKESKPLFWQTISLVFCMLWLLPTLFLLRINFDGHIVGPSIGCLRSSCRINLHDTTQIQQAQVLAKDDHNALIGLQLAAKALEAW